jgi:hypothetical protein
MLLQCIRLPAFSLSIWLTAGPVWDDKTGATGYGAKLIVDWVNQQVKD